MKLNIQIGRYSGTHLHANDGIDEEEHGNEQAHVWQSLPEKMKTEEGFVRAVTCIVTVCTL